MRFCTLNLIILEDPEEPGGHEAKLPLAGVRQCGYHLRHGGFPANTGQAVVVGEKEPVGFIMDKSEHVRRRRETDSLWGSGQRLWVMTLLILLNKMVLAIVRTSEGVFICMISPMVT